MTRLSIVAGVLSISFLFAAPAFAVTQWQAKPDASSISWTIEVGKGNIVQGHCSSFASDIVFDPDDLEHSSVKVIIDMKSCRTGAVDTDTALPGAEWFNENSFPKAEFNAAAFRALGGNQYAADGELTLKGVTRPLVLDFTLDIDGADAHVIGSALIKRMDFGIGIGTSGDYAGLDVNVKIDLRATRK